MDIFDVLTMIGGLCLFLFGMNIMGEALERAAGNSLRSLLGKLTTNRMLGFLTGDEAVGYYNAAVRIKSILVSIVTSLGAVLLPRASYYVEQGKMDQFRQITRKALNFVFLAAVPMTLYFILFAKQGIFLLSG